MADFSDAQLAEITRLINANPAIRAALVEDSQRPVRLQGRQGQGFWDPVNQERLARPPADGRIRQGQEAVLKQFGIDLPPDFEDYHIVAEPNTGQLSLDRKNFMQRNAEWVYPAMIVGGGVAAGLTAPASGLTAAQGVEASAAPTGSLAGTGFGTVPIAAGTSAGTIPAVVGAATSGANAVTPAVVGGGTETTEQIVRRLLGQNNGGVDTTGLLLGLGGSLISALGAVRPQQRQSFQGTKADPVALLSGAQQAISGAAPMLFDQAKTGAQLTGPVPNINGTVGLRRNTSTQDPSLSAQPPTPEELDQFHTALSLLGRPR